MATRLQDRDIESRPAEDNSVVHLNITRRSLILLCGLLVAPWVVLLLVVAGKPLWQAIAPVGVLSGQKSVQSVSVRKDADDDPDDILPRIVERKAGRWGQLQYTRIAVELPEEFVFVPPRDSKPVRWFFKGFSKEQTLDYLEKSGLTAEQLAEVRQAKVELALGGCWITPPEKVILQMSPGTRCKIYGTLVQYVENRPHIDPFCYREQLLPERLERSGLSDASLGLFKSLLYNRTPPWLLFADMETALRQIKDEGEQRRFVKTVTRKSTLLAKLRVTPESNVDELVSYWSVGGRAKDLRPLLDSLCRVEGGCMIEIVHLLPRFIRHRLYSYPFTSEESEGVKHDCFWSAFNTFSDEPDDRFSDMNHAAKILQQQYYSILKPSQLGDLVFLATEAGAAVHAATYIADDLVFTKNGATYTQPWILMRMDDMLAIYSVPQPVESPLKVHYYRRKSF